jgi:ribosomal protein S18 acetylase RimI-like enzyme
MPAYRGRGIGRALVAEGLLQLRERGATEIELEVEAKNDKALALYRDAGFVVVHRTPTFSLPLLT